MTIYIRPDGTISGSNEPLLFEFLTKNVYTVPRAWKESCIDFEDQRQAMSLFPNSAFSHTNRRGGLRPDTIIENVDVETEVVCGCENLKGPFNECINAGSKNPYKCVRTVLRIKDKP